MAKVGGAGTVMPVNYNYYGRNPYLRAYKDIPGFFPLKTRSTAKVSTGTTGHFRFEKGTKPSEDCIKYLQEFLLFDKEVIEVEKNVEKPNVYTWALKQFDADGTIHLLAAPALSNQEVGTLHANLDILTTPGKILIAGELHIAPDKTFTYNILSGTYSKKLPQENKNAGMNLLESTLTELGATKIVRAGDGEGPILEVTKITLPDYMATNYTKFCGMLFHPSTVEKSGGARRRRHTRHRRARTRRLKRA